MAVTMEASATLGRSLDSLYCGADDTSNVGSLGSWSYEGVKFTRVGEVVHLQFSNSLASKGEEVVATVSQLIKDCSSAEFGVYLVILQWDSSEALSDAPSGCQPCLEELVAVIASMTVPVIGLVSGQVAGFAALLLQRCDFVVADAATVFGLHDVYQASDLGIVHEVVAHGGAASRVKEVAAALMREAQSTPLEDSAARKERLRHFGAVQLSAMQAFLFESLRNALQQQRLVPNGDLVEADENLALLKESTLDNCSSISEGTKSMKPARRNFAELFEHHDGPITSMMVRNLPCSVMQEQLAAAIDLSGFAGKYDWLYLPMKKRRQHGSKQALPSRPSNLGYAFVNFPNPEDANAFASTFDGYTFKGTKSLKRCTIGPAHVQSATSSPPSECTSA